MGLSLSIQNSNTHLRNFSSLDFVLLDFARHHGGITAASFHNMSLFFSLSVRDSFSSESVQKCYQNIGDVLKLLKPIVDFILNTSIASDEQLSKALEQLVYSTEECTNLFENWHPLASRMHLVLEADLLTGRIQNSVLQFLRLLIDSHQSLPGELSSSSLELCAQKVKDIGINTISTSINNEVNNQKGSHGPSPQRLIEIAGCLGLRSNLRIYIEAVALKKLKEDAEQAENLAAVDHLEDLISLVTHMHYDLVMLRLSQSCTPFLIPGDLCCPLSLELMTDPVILSSGQTYERAFIRKWFDLGLTVCPKTMQPLTHTKLIPNYTAKALIANWCESKNMKLPDPMNNVNGNFSLRSCCDTEMKKLVEDLKSNSKESLTEATGQLRLILKQNKNFRIQITYFGVIRLLADLLYSTVPKIQENAVTSLFYLAIENDNKVAIADEDSIGPLIRVLQVGTPEARENLAATLFCLSMIHVNKLRIGRLGAIVPIIELLRKGTPQGKNNAAIVLFNLSISHENRCRIVQAGGVRLLIELVSHPGAGMVDKAVAVLANLAKIPEGRTAIGQAGGIRALVNTLELGSLQAKANAASAIMKLCVNSSRFCTAAIQEDVMPPLVALSRSEMGNPRAKEKVVSLLSYIRNQQCNNSSEVCSVTSETSTLY